MSERMNKERAIEQIKKLIEFTKKAREVIGTPQKDIEIVIGENQFYLSDELLQALDIAIESLDNEWVDVRDRLPKEKEYVLICTNYGRKIYVARRSYGTIDVDFDASKCIWWSGSAHKPENVIAWKPLPQPYERKE